MVAGLEEVSSGRIFIGERCVNDLEPGERDIAMVFQNYALYPHMTVRENMSFGLRMKRVAPAEIARRVDQAAQILSIETLLDRRPRALSGGQRQRVALGRAIVRQPQVFLFDEPLSNLDAKLRVEMRTEIARLHQRLRTTMIYVTHDQVEAMTLGERIVIMNQGVIQQVDTPLQLYHAPANRFVAGFIGSPAMNFLEGRVADGWFAPAAGAALDAHDGHVAHQASGPGFGLHVGPGVPQGKVTLGVRPEDLELTGQSAPLLEGTVDVIERIGHETMMYINFHGQQIVARLGPDVQHSPGDRLRLFVRPGRQHLFAAEGEVPRLAEA
jgi:multiple sugar transport system ATP-binding protein